MSEYSFHLDPLWRCTSLYQVLTLLPEHSVLCLTQLRLPYALLQNGQLKPQEFVSYSSEVGKSQKDGDRFNVQ